MPNNPLDFKTKPWLRQPVKALTTAPIITALTPSSGRIAGGDPVVISGSNFRRSSTGAFPTVLFGLVAGTVTAVAANGTSVTVTTPVSATVGYVDVTVTNPDTLESDSLVGAFLYYAGSLIDVTPAYSLTSGGVNVIVRGVSLVTGSVFTFGGTLATGVTFIDDTQISMTVPAHVAGWVDVVMTEPGGSISRLEKSFQFTTLARGSDIRRFPGTTVNKSLGSQPWTASFKLDGQSNRPIAGEEVQVTDPFDGGRVLYHGIIQQAQLEYEGLINQLVWSTMAGDFQYMLNKYRPIGIFLAVSASEVVRTLMGKYAPDFLTTFVQTKLAPVSVSFDGTKTMSEALDIVARAIGGGRWYLDSRTLHFFNPPAPTTIVIPAGSTGTGADFTTPVLSIGNPLGSTETYAKAYYAVRVTFLYSNGTESRLGPTSNAIASDGTHFLTVTSLPIGNNPSGTITCVGRKVYYLQGSNGLANAVQINDNVTATVSFAPLADVQPSTGDNTFGDPVTVTAGGSGSTQQALTFVPTFQSAPFYWVGNDAGMIFELGSSPKFSTVTSKADLSGGFQISILPSGSVGLFGAQAYGYWVQFACNLVYPDGSATQLSDWTENSYNPFAGYFLANIADTARGQLPNYTCFYYPGVIGAPLINGKKPYQINLWMRIVGQRLAAAGGGGSGGANDVAFLNPVGQMFGSCPYYDNVDGILGPSLGGAPLDTSTVVDVAPINFGVQPVLVPGSTDPTYIWPNPDGPYLEDFANPNTINDSDPLLLREGESGSQPFCVMEDITQLRNRIKVYGASSVVIADALAGAYSVSVANGNVFPVNGGQVVSANGVEIDFFSVSSAMTSASGTITPAKLLLTKPLPQAIPNGTTVSFFCLAEDKDAQAKRGRIELDSLGNKTDGVHEYIINDPSLNTTQAVYLRANAELSIYKDPILTIRYSTRDPTRPGGRVTINLSSPPCKGTFLIQQVTIDQIRDEGDALAPRYTVVATNVLYDLTNFFLLLTADSQLAGAGSQSSGDNSQVGVISSTVNQASSSGSSDFDASAQTITKFSAFGAVASASTTVSPMLGPTGWSVTGNSATTHVEDAQGYSWVRLASTSVASANASTANSVMGQRAEFNPYMRLRIRIAGAVPGPSTGHQRWWIGYKETSAPIFSNADTQTGTGRGFGLCYRVSGGAIADGGWTLWTSDNVTFATGDVVSQAPLIQNGYYDIIIATSGSGAYFTATVNGFTSKAMAIPQAVLARDLLWAAFQYQIVTAEPVSYDFLSCFLQRDIRAGDVTP
jgi:hypothetical protein